MLRPLRRRAPLLPTLALLAGTALLAPSAARATTPAFPFNFADSDQQVVTTQNPDPDDNGMSTFYFTIKGGLGTAGLKTGVPHTINVGTPQFSVDNSDQGPGVNAHSAISRQITIDGITQTLTQNDFFKPDGYVDVDAGPTLTFDDGAKGRVDVTPQEYQYETDSGAAPKYQYTLLLRPAAVVPASLTLSPTSVTYPASSTGTVTLARAAPDAETIVLTSSNPAAVSVPATLAVSAGQQTVTFPITTTHVDSDTTVTIGAAAGGTTKTAAFIVKTPKTSFTYSFAAVPFMEFDDPNGDNDALLFEETGGSGTVNLTKNVPYTITVGEYSFNPDFDFGDPSSHTLINADISHAGTVNGSTQSFSQPLSASLTVDDDHGYFSASVSDSQILVYNFGTKGIVEVTALGTNVNDSGSYSAQYTFLLLPADTLSSIAVSPTKVYGGATTYGKVTLAAVAPPGGQVVSLATSDASVASVPATVTVPAGVKSAVFPITTDTVDEDSAITFHATANGKSVTASLTVLARYEFSGTVKSGSAGLSGVTLNASSTGNFILTSTAVNNAAIPDNSAAGLSTTIKPKGSGTITGLVVGIDITHPNIGDLRVTLKGPDGTTAVLYNQSGGSQQNILGSYPVLRTPVDSLSVFNGKAMQGTWTLLVQDLAGGNVGTLNGWNLTFTYNGTVTGSGTTATNGTYTVPDLKEGTYTATPVKSGTSFTPVSRSVTVGPTVSDPNPDGIDFAKH